MSNFLMDTLAVLGGVIGGAIGFLVIAFVAILLVLPYVLLTWRKSGTSRDPLGPVDTRNQERSKPRIDSRHPQSHRT